MGHIKEPKGIDLAIPPSKPDKEADQAVSDYIKKQKLKNGKKIIETFLTMSIQKDIKTGCYVGQIEKFPGAILSEVKHAVSNWEKQQNKLGLPAQK